jgi:3-hydroxy-9,10-secoandrosta-1,3,5(10)-triene-9,17-dione monooxygenase reductase component
MRASEEQAQRVGERVAATEPQRLDFRRTLAEFASGVTVITGGTADAPAGFACQSFSSVSLEPPLVMFCVDHESRTWPALRAGGRFCANILAEGQQDLCQRFGSRTGEKFEGLAWEWSSWETPALARVLARVHAEIGSIHPEGDHDIVIGRVVALEHLGTRQRPMVFFRGTFDIDAHATDALHTWTMMGGWI